MYITGGTQCYKPQGSVRSKNRNECVTEFYFFPMQLYLCCYTVANNYKKQLSSRLKTLEKEHERTLAERMVKHKGEVEVWKSLNMHCVDITFIYIQDLISRFKDSAQIEEDFKRTSKLLKV